MFRPWPAEDGLLVRLRLVGGRLQPTALAALLDLAEAHGDGRVYLTSRANVQLRGLPAEAAASELAAELADQFSVAGLLPSRSHELVRNVMVTPDTGLPGGRGRADLAGVAAALDELICADPVLAGLPARFLFVLDDGAGDLLRQRADLGLVALDAQYAQVRFGHQFGQVLALAQAPAALGALARKFLARRGTGESAAWHVHELGEDLTTPVPGDIRLPEPAPPLAFGAHPAGRHVEVGEQGLDRAQASAWGLLPGTGRATGLVITPSYGVLTLEENR